MFHLLHVLSCVNRLTSVIARGGSQQQQQQQVVAPPVIQEQVIVEEVPVEGATGKDESPADWMVDPNEPRYCLCNEVSYGEMVGCDNDDVSLKNLINTVKREMLAVWKIS